ncbi:MAG: gamma-glutamylcyclotransferase family protein [Campylobacterota bacterium]|nr:gamma-glutamylcyclotransferase family protein [Campylobacterota bacterium]
MTISDQIKKQLYKYPNNQTISFENLRLCMNNTTNIDSFRKALHRLHKQGIITINGRGQFIKEEKFRIYLFVYGSLKKGFQNHTMLSEANYISKAQTTSKFAMYTEDNQNYPYIIKDNITGQKIDGELYEITRKDLLDKIDDFEGAPNYFKQTIVSITTRSKKIKAKTYILSSPKVPLYEKPMKSWTNHNIRLNIDFDAYYKSFIN